MSNTIENIYNYSQWGDNLISVYLRYIFKGPLPIKIIDLVVIGYGTNDAHYYHSLNSSIESPQLHKELLLNLINIIKINLCPKK